MINNKLVQRLINGKRLYNIKSLRFIFDNSEQSILRFLDTQYLYKPRLFRDSLRDSLPQYLSFYQLFSHK